MAARTAVPGGLAAAVVELGTNDVLVGTSPGAFEAQYRALMSRIRSTSPRAALVCIGVWRQNNLTLDTVIRRDCAEAGGTFVSGRDLYGQRAMHSVAGGRTWIGRADDFHPGDAGHAAIAQRIGRALGV